MVWRSDRVHRQQLVSCDQFVILVGYGNGPAHFAHLRCPQRFCFCGQGNLYALPELDRFDETQVLESEVC